MNFNKKNIRTAFTFLLGIASACSLNAQTKRTKLPETVNSVYDELCPVVSADGNTLYFVRSGDPANSGGAKAGQDIWYSTKDYSGNWTTALNVGAPINNKGNNSVCGLSHDGQTMYLTNIYRSTKKMSPGVSYSRMKDGVWESPVALRFTNANLRSGYFSFFITRDQKYLILSMQSEQGMGEEDLYVSTREIDTWSVPVSLGKTINTTGFETSPFLAEDGKTLYFCSDGHQGLGKGDIFVSKRLDDSWTNWSTPENLGTEINTAGLDNNFSISSTGDAYFVSAENEKDLGDIYMVKLFNITDYVKDPIFASVVKKTEEPKKPVAAVSQIIKADTLALTIAFEQNSSVLTKDAVESLNNFSNSLRSKKYSLVLVNGFADMKGTVDANKVLSQQRAEAVRNYLLISDVIVPIQAKGFGISGDVRERKVIITAVPQ